MPFILIWLVLSCDKTWNDFQAGKQASNQANKQVGKQATKQTSEQAGKQASNGFIRSRLYDHIITGSVL